MASDCLLLHRHTADLGHLQGYDHVGCMHIYILSLCIILCCMALLQKVWTNTRRLAGASLICSVLIELDSIGMSILLYGWVVLK